MLQEQTGAFESLDDQLEEELSSPTPHVAEPETKEISEAKSKEKLKKYMSTV